MLIIVMLAVPNLTFLQRHAVRAELGNLTTFITYVQRVAACIGQDQPIIINTERNSLEGAGRIHRLGRGVQFGILPGVKGPPAQPTAAITQPVTFQGGRIMCYAQGTVQAGTLYIVDERGTCLYAVSCPVGPVTYLRTYYFDGSWKRCS